MESFIITSLFIGLILAFFISRDAGKRNMNEGLWFLIVLILSIVGIILYLIVRNPLPSSSDNENIKCESELKKCPDCAEYIKVDARVCRFCGFRFTTKGEGTSTHYDSSSTSEFSDLVFPMNIKITDNDAKLFSEDNNQSNVIKRLPIGEEVVALRQLGEFNEWLKVKVQNDEGYILKCDVDL
jgi:RNA polymerase subunit RPABC4/transcription elongation factor Spt4